jgi:hypothetical protein
MKRYIAAQVTIDLPPDSGLPVVILVALLSHLSQEAIIDTISEKATKPGLRSFTICYREPAEGSVRND